MKVRRGFALKGQRLVEREGQVLDSARSERSEHDCPHAYLGGYFALIFKLGILAVDDLFGFFDGGVEHVIEEHHVALTRGQRALTLEADHAERDVHAVLCPIVAHELEHLEKLTEVQILLISHDVQVLVKVVVLFAVDGGSKVARSVQRRAVGL